MTNKDPPIHILAKGRQMIMKKCHRYIVKWCFA